MGGCTGKTKASNGHSLFKKPHYCIKSCKSGRVMCIDPNPSAQNQVMIWDETKKDNQRFVIEQKGPDYILKCKKDKVYITVDGPQNGARVYGTNKLLG
jgi:hypothetical protein